DHEDVAQAERALTAVPIAPSNAAFHQRPHQLGDDFHFLWAGTLIRIVPGRNEPQPRARERNVTEEHLPLDARARVQPSLVKELGREPAYGGREPPGLLEEEPAVVRDRLGAIQDVLERRDRGAFGMRALDRLLELLRIAEQNQALRARGDREHVRKGHLPGLV